LPQADESGSVSLVLLNCRPTGTRRSTDTPSSARAVVLPTVMV
jgi:hypothetical protein